MLKVSNEQIEQFDKVFMERFVKRLIGILREDHPEDVSEYSNEELHELVREGIDRAESYGLESDNDVETFVTLLFTVGWFYDTHPHCQRYLVEEDFDPSERMRFLLDATTGEDWVEISAWSNNKLDEMETHDA